MKFKVGDKVKVKESAFVNNGSLSNFDIPNKFIGKITSIEEDTNSYRVKIKLPGWTAKDSWWVGEWELEEIE